MNVVITGASRGIGLELCRQALQNGHRVLAVVRSKEALSTLSQQHGSILSVCELDLVSSQAPARLVEAVSGWDKVDVLINNAGILTEGESADDFMRSFQINSVVPFLTTQALLPKLKGAKIVHVTSLMGSVQDNSSGGFYAYRASKAALNMINKSLSIDHPEMVSIVIHPGWVQTDMGGPSAPLPVATSAHGIWKVIADLKPNDTGKFFDYRGRSLPW